MAGETGIERPNGGRRPCGNLNLEIAVEQIYGNMNIQGRENWSLFDFGSHNTYVVQDVADLLPTSGLVKPIRATLDGSAKEVTHVALLNGELEGLPISMHAMVIDRLGDDETGRPIEILFGALAMQQWGVRLIPEHEKIDLSHYPLEFVEF